MKVVIRTEPGEVMNRLGLEPGAVSSAVRLDRVVVDTGSGLWELHVEVQDVSAGPVLAMLRSAVAAKAGGHEGRIVFRPVYKVPVPPAQFLDAHWPDICADIAAVSVRLCGLLEPSRRHVAAGGIEIEVNGEDAATALNEGAAAVVRGWLGRCPGAGDAVRFVTADFAEEVSTLREQRKNETQARVREESATAAAARRKMVFDTGKASPREPQEIKAIVTAPPLNSAVTFEGLVFKFEPSSSEQMPFDKFCVTDFTSSLECVARVKAGGNGGRKSLEIGTGEWVRVSGLLGKSLKDELEVRAERIERIARKERLDTADGRRIELHAHTKMSQADGVTGIEELIHRAAKWGHPAVGITDHGNVHAFPEAYSAAKKAGVKVLLGMEGYLAAHETHAVRDVAARREQGGRGLSRDDLANFKRGVYHIVIYARNRAGLRNLYELVTLSHIRYFYNKPLLPRAVLEQHREGLVIGSACESGEIFKLVLAEKLGTLTPAAFAEQVGKAMPLYDYLEIQPRANNQFFVTKGVLASETDLQAINRRILDLGRQYGKPVVATGDVHVLDEHEVLLRRVLQVGQGFDKDTDESGDVPLFFKTTDEMLAEFAYLGDEAARDVVIANPGRIAAMIEDVPPIPDGFHPPTLEGATDDLRRICAARCGELYGPKPHPLIAQRMERELSDIVSHKFADLYMLAQKVVKKSLDDGYIVGSRGSVGSSFVAFLSGITEVNSLPPHFVCPKCFATEFINYDGKGERRATPLDGIEAEVGVDLPARQCAACAAPMDRFGFDIPFETFVGFKGDKTPDIDLNFASEYQPRAHRFVEDLFGREHVYRAGTIATIQGNTAFGFVKKYLEASGEQWPKAEIDRVTDGLKGIKRTTGQHPGGVIILPHDKDITEFCPAHYPANKSDSPQTTHFDYHAMEEQLLKLDILGHEDPTQIRMLGEYTGKDITKAPLDDPKTLAIFSGLKTLGVTEKAIGSRVGTFGIPEFGTEFVRGMLEETKPKTFADLIRISGLSHGTDVWLNNARDIIRAGKATLKQAICTRDDIMHDLSARGVEPFTAFKIMERVRKGKGLEPADVEVMRKQRIPDWYIESCQKIKYMFPKAHAVAYVINAVRIAYCKVQYPAAFYASYFTIMRQSVDTQTIAKGKAAIKDAIAELDKTGRKKLTNTQAEQLVVYELALEMLERKIEMKPIDIHLSHATRCLIEGTKIIPPLTAFPGLGESVAETIVAARQQKPFSDREDLKHRTKLNQSLVEAMVQAGILAGMPESAQHDLDFGVAATPAAQAGKAAPQQPAAPPAAKKPAAKKTKKQDAPPPADSPASLF